MTEDAEILKKSENISSVTDFLDVIFHISKSKEKIQPFFTEGLQMKHGKTFLLFTENNKTTKGIITVL